MAKQSTTRIVILGAGYAGMAATLRLAHKARRLPVEIMLVNGSSTFVERIRLHQVAASEQIRQRSIPELLKGTRVRFMQGWVSAMTPQAQQVTVRTEAGSETLGYDYLLYALGSRADKDSVAGVHEHALAVGNPGDSDLLRQRLQQLAAAGPDAGQVVVVGGGLTGIETATEIAERYPGLCVHLVTAGRVGYGLSKRGRAYLRRTFDRLGVAVQEGARVERVEANAVVTGSGQAIPFGLCIWAGPFQALPLPREAGLAVNSRGQILIDAAMRSLSSSTIYAAGDSAAFAPEVGLTMRMACATAVPMAAHAADNLYAQLVNEPQQPFRFGYLVQCISLGRHDGLIQRVQADDNPTEHIMTGRPAAWFKEAICRSAALAATVSWIARAYNWWRWDGTATQERSLRQKRVDAQQLGRQG
jgi:NADH:ubiquinone reductase (H+-translocating)